MYRYVLIIIYSIDFSTFKNLFITLFQIMCLRHGKQLYLLLWKNFNLQRRRWIVTLIEIFIPAVFAFLLVYIRHRVVGTVYDKPIIWKPFSVDELPQFPFSSYTLNISFTPDIPITRKIVEKVLQSEIRFNGKTSLLFLC